MNSISFPNMFRPTSTIIKDDCHEATFQNILLILGAEKGDFTCDPYFGIRLRRYFYDQNNYILKDVIIDEILTQLRVFIPQLIITRKDITITIDKAKMHCTIKATNRLDFTVDTFNLVLFDGDKE